MNEERKPTPGRTLHLSSSLRDVEPLTTLAFAKQVAAGLGISRVTNITQLDNVGVPVFASVRPTAVLGSLCVNAGKGIRTLDAKVGAYMEAIEFAVAEPGGNNVEVALCRVGDVLDCDQRPGAILDLCPIVGKKIDLGAPLACVPAADLIDGGFLLVPAEQVLLPYVGEPGTGLFGSHSNGLCSGNSVDEATLHGLFEVVERDVRSFNYVLDTASRVRLESLPDAAQDCVEKIVSAGLSLCVRSLPNTFGIPVFEAILYDPFSKSRSYLNGGYGCHLDREIAVTRALTEAIQSRLSWIHGGRDDLAEPAARDAAFSRAVVAESAQADFRRASNWGDKVELSDVEDGASETTSVAQALDGVIRRLKASGIRQVCRVVLRADDHLAVVRVIVPGLEYMQPHSSHRCGPRLHEFAKQHRT